MLFLIIKIISITSLDGDGPDLSQFKEGVAKVTSKISSVASNVIETFQVRQSKYGEEGERVKGGRGRWKERNERGRERERQGKMEREREIGLELFFSSSSL